MFNQHAMNMGTRRVWGSVELTTIYGMISQNQAQVKNTGGVEVGPGLLALPATERPERKLYRQHHEAELGRAAPGLGPACEQKTGTASDCKHGH